MPADIRRRLQIGPDSVLDWVVEGDVVKVIPLPPDPIRAFRGSGRKGLVESLLRDRRRDRRRENA